MQGADRDTGRVTWWERMRGRLQAWQSRAEPPRPGGVPLKEDRADVAVNTPGTPFELKEPIDEGAAQTELPRGRPQR